MLIHVTQKLARLLGEKNLAEHPPIPNSKADWHATAVETRAGVLIVVMHTQTLYAVIVLAARVEDRISFLMATMEAIREDFTQRNFLDAISRVISPIDQTILAKATDRSALASLNYAASEIKRLLANT